MLLADRAIALIVNGTVIPLVFSVHQVDDAIPGEEMAVPGVSAWHYAVKQISPRATASMMFTGVPTPIK